MFVFCHLFFLNILLNINVFYRNKRFMVVKRDYILHFCENNEKARIFDVANMALRNGNVTKPS